MRNGEWWWWKCDLSDLKKNHDVPVAKSLLAVVNGKEDGSDFIPVSRRQKSKLSVPPLPLERLPLYRTANHHRKIVPGCCLLPPPYRVLLMLRKTITCEWNDQGAHNFSQEVAPSQKVDISLWSPDIAQIDRAFINGYFLPYYAIEKSIPDGNCLLCSVICGMKSRIRFEFAIIALI